MQERDVIGHVRSVTPTFAGHVAAMEQYDFIGNVRSIGLIGAMEFAAEKHSQKKFGASHKIAAQAVAIIQKHGVILRALPGDIIGFCPPLIISKAELDDMFKRIHDAMSDVAELAAKLR
jgi:4-aminobutyrate--pyruvate transaminase